ncbi:homoserine kinase [Paenibacillus crassostreae]|uniref:Homoserine kinase n=1 Tax=Paenibacillus crassostreae TaxID=1763538 RepID=A0A167EEY2_9BACL|nr:homoserine kinase [Paenibacillus crassostreae]AOZ91895.1 homoserine kinase [Paenibacillus crassostreae]OAB75474.1 homoserine kinase [Paenibacillus crassostreae]
MNRTKGVRIKVPASTANLGPGFDTLGMALSLYSWVEMKESESTCIRLYGDNMKGLPKDKNNLMYRVAQLIFDEVGVSIPELEISMYSEVPLTRGLGSSASAIVGGMVAANALIGSPLSNEKLFDMATSLEGHPDNVGASLFGGIITAVWDGVHADHIKLEPHADLEVLVIIPDFQLSTSEARQVLPSHISREDAVYNISRSSLLVAALSSGRFDLIGKAMSDRLHQPYRASLVPGMVSILEEAPNRGALGVALSGAGPTLLAIVDRQNLHKKDLESYLLDTMKSYGILATARWLNPSTEGATNLAIVESDLFVDLIKGEVEV